MIAVGRCGPDFEPLAQRLGGIDCATANPVLTVRAPHELTNATLPVIELTVVLLAVAALVHAVRQGRRGDPTGLVLWCASVVQLLVLEPPLYFPDAVGLQDRLGLIFVHNVFTVQFLYDRLPLYIVAFYPAVTYAVYQLVRRTGVLGRRPLVAAACFAVAFHCLYEVFDGLGPQLRWWIWNPAAPSNTPMVGSVPLTSALMFATASPFGIALALDLLVVRPVRRARLPGWSLALRTVAVALSGILAMVVFALPYGLFGPDPDRFTTGRELVLWAELLMVAGVAARAWWVRAPAPERSDRYGVGAVAVLLGVLLALWAGALPAALRARGGWTAQGTPVGALPYVTVCALAVVALLVLATAAAATATAARESGSTSVGRVRATSPGPDPDRHGEGAR